MLTAELDPSQITPASLVCEDNQETQAESEQAPPKPDPKQESIKRRKAR